MEYSSRIISSFDFFGAPSANRRRRWVDADGIRSDCRMGGFAFASGRRASGDVSCGFFLDSPSEETEENAAFCTFYAGGLLIQIDITINFCKGNMKQKGGECLNV